MDDVTALALSGAEKIVSTFPKKQQYAFVGVVAFGVCIYCIFQYHNSKAA